MTTRARLVGLMLVAGLGVSAAVVRAQDPVQVGPNVYTQVFENDRVRISRIRFEPGASIPMHEHPDHFLYVLTPGTITLSYPDGTSKEFAGETGQVVWIPAESHAAVNTGTTEFTALVVELKPLPTYTTGQ